MKEQLRNRFVGPVKEFSQDVSWRNFFGWRTLGFTLERAWIYLLFLDATSSFMTWNGESIQDFVYIGSSIVLATVLIVSAVARQHIKRFVSSPRFSILGAIFATIGTLAISSSPAPGLTGIISGVLGAFLTGFGSAIIMLSYGEIYRNVNSVKTVVEVSAAVFLAALVFLLVGFLPRVIGCIVCALLPLASGWILVFKLKVWTPRLGMPDATPVIKIGAFTTRIGACACLVGLADGVVRAVFMNATEMSAQEFYQYPLPVASFITLLILCLCQAFTAENGLRQTYRAVVFIMASFFMLLPVFTDVSGLERVISLTGYGTFNALIWVILADIAYRYRFSALAVFGIGWGMVTVGALLGSIVGQMVCVFAPFSPQQISLIAFLATLAILVSYLFVFNESNLADLAKKPSEGEEAVIEPSYQRFQRRCKIAAEIYGLTPRETEIMILAAKGRTGARIQEELFLSRGTVTTHLRHIYQKMDVHSKQELLDVIERVSE